MAGLGTFNRTGGTVNLTGTLDLLPVAPSGADGHAWRRLGCLELGGQCRHGGGLQDRAVDGRGELHTDWHGGGECYDLRRHGPE